MLQKLYKQHKKSEGFTIIEVLIVLAIAGLILLIVFLAVPALERTARNTQRKNDAAAIGGAISNFASNNAGLTPTLLADNGTTNTIDVTTTGTTNVEIAKIGYYASKGTITQVNAAGQDGQIYISAAAASPAAPQVVAPGAETATKVSTNTVVILYGQDCTPIASSRATAIYYVTETGTGNGSLQCLDE